MLQNSKNKKNVYESIRMVEIQYKKRQNIWAGMKLKEYPNDQ